MPYFAHLTSTLKHNIDTDLGQKTIIVGPNESGKSAICEALQLAATGRSADLPGTGAELMAFARGSALSVTATADDGRTSRFSVTGSTAKASKPEHAAAFSAAFVLDDVRALLAKNIDTQREAVLKAISPTKVLARVRESIPDEMRNVWAESEKRVVAALGPKTPETDVLVAALADLRERLKASNAVIRDANKAGARPEPVSPEALAEARANLQAANDSRAWLEKRENAAVWLARLESEKAEAAVEQPADDENAPVSSEMLGLARRIMELQPFRSLLDSLGTCPLSGAPSNAWDAEGANELRDEAAATIAQADAERMTASESQLRSLAAIEEDIARANEILNATHAVIETPIADLETKVRDLEARDALVRQWDATQTAAVREKAQNVILKSVESLVETAVARLLDEVVTPFANEITRFLPEGQKASVQLFDGAKSTFRFGVTDANGTFVSRKPLSGSARVTLIAALAAVLSRASAAEYRGVVIDEVAFDAEHLAALLDGLSAAIDSGLSQAIVTMVHCPIDADALREAGWHVIERA